MLGVKQAVIAGLGASAVAGGGYGAYYLLTDKTIEDRLNREEFSLVKGSEGYQVAFKELRGDTNFINDIKSYGTDITATSGFDKGGEALNKWCNAKMKESLNLKDVDNLIKKVKEYCKVRPLTIAAKLGKELFTGDWNARLTALKPSGSASDGDLLKDLTSVNGQLKSLENSTENKVVDALSKWCQDNYSKKLIEDKDDNIYGKVDKRCT